MHPSRPARALPGRRWLRRLERGPVLRGRKGRRGPVSLPRRPGRQPGWRSTKEGSREGRRQRLGDAAPRAHRPGPRHLVHDHHGRGFGAAKPATPAAGRDPMDGHRPSAGRGYRHDRPEDHGGARAPLRAPGTSHDGRQRGLRPRPRPGRGVRAVRGSGADLDHRGLELRADHVAHHRPGHLLRDRRVDPADDRRDRRFGRRGPLPEDPPAPPAHRRGRRHDRARAGYRDGCPDGAAAHDPRLHGLARGQH